MRVSSNMLSYNFMSSLNKSLARQNELQEKLSDGKAIHRPSDDPVRAVRSLRFNINLRENEQYTQHVKDSISWMETSDSAMSSLSSLTIKVKELAVKAVAPNPDLGFDAIAEELDGIINHMVEIGNTKIGDRYIFAGQDDKTKPFERRMVDFGPPIGKKDAVVYSGDSNAISMRAQPGVITPTQDGVNVKGSELFGPLTTAAGENAPVSEMFNHLIQLKDELLCKNTSIEKRPIAQSNLEGGKATLSGSYAPASDNPQISIKVTNVGVGGVVSGVEYSLDGGTPVAVSPTGAPPSFLINGVSVTIGDSPKNTVGDTYGFKPSQGTEPDLEWISNGAIAWNDADHNSLLGLQTELGARMSMYNQAESLLEGSYVTINDYLSANEDLDIPKAMVDFKTSESVYRTALSIGAKLLPPTLADFLN